MHFSLYVGIRRLCETVLFIYLLEFFLERIVLKSRKNKNNFFIKLK